MRGLGLLDATLLIVGSVIGSGIFFAPSITAGYLQSPGLLLGLWVLGGLLTLAGALSYAELAAATPRAGGQYVLLSEAFSPLFGFLYGWTLLFAINTGFVAAVAVAFAKTLGFFVPGDGGRHREGVRLELPAGRQPHRQPDLPRPCRAWGYPIVPLLFVAVSVFFLVYMPVADPRDTGLGLLLTAAGIPAYLYWRRHR